GCWTDRRPRGRERRRSRRTPRPRPGVRGTQRPRRRVGSRDLRCRNGLLPARATLLSRSATLKIAPPDALRREWGDQGPARREVSMAQPASTRYAFLADTYETEILKVLSVWSMFEDLDLAVRPHPSDRRGRSVLEHMIHQSVSENFW